MITGKQIDIIRTYIEEAGIAYEADVSLKEFSYFRSGGSVKLIVYPGNDHELESFVRFLQAKKYEYKIIGDTSNLMFLDDIMYGVLLSLKTFNRIHLHEADNLIEAQAGAGLPELSRKALLWGYSGFEGLEGIPGTIGGGVIMNAGAYDSEIKDRLLHVNGFRKNGDKFCLSLDELEFSNRNSLLRDQPGEFIVTSVWFKAHTGDTSEIFHKMELYHAKRHKHQDFLYPTLGSLFSVSDIYSALAHDNKSLQFKMRWFRKLHYSKKIRRETPMNRIKLNQFVCNYFGWEFDMQPFSDKTMNCITNRGQHTDCFLDYIEMLKKKLPASARIENEVMLTHQFDGGEMK